MPQTALWVKYCYFPKFVNMETDDFKEELPEHTHFVSGSSRTGITNSNDKALPQACRVQCSQRFWHAVSANGLRNRGCLCICVGVSFPMCYKENYNQTKVTTKRLDEYGAPPKFTLLSRPTNRSSNTGHTSHAQCTGSFSQGTPDVRETAIWGKDELRTVSCSVRV